MNAVDITAPNDGSAARTVMPLVCSAGIASVRRTVASGTVPTAVTAVTGGMARTIVSAVGGSGVGGGLVGGGWG